MYSVGGEECFPPFSLYVFLSFHSARVSRLASTYYFCNQVNLTLKNSTAYFNIILKMSHHQFCFTCSKYLYHQILNVVIYKSLSFHNYYIANHNALLNFHKNYIIYNSLCNL